MKVLLLFTYGVSLKLWNKLGLIDREISLYKHLFNKGVEFKLITYGDNKDLEYDAVIREKLGKNARKFIINNYSLELVVNKEYRVYKQILRK